MTKEELLQTFAAAYEQLIEMATLAAQHDIPQGNDMWGPREIVGHLAGWEIMAGVRIPKIVAGMPPAEFPEQVQQEVMNDAINAALTTLIGEQDLDILCEMLRKAYQKTVRLLSPLDDTFFQAGQYVYERTRDVIEHCKEHMEQLIIISQP